MFDQFEKNYAAFSRIIKKPLQVVMLLSLLLIVDVLSYSELQSKAIKIFPELIVNRNVIFLNLNKAQQGTKNTQYSHLSTKVYRKIEITFGLYSLDAQIANFYANLESVDNTLLPHDARALLHQVNEIIDRMGFFFQLREFSSEQVLTIASQDTSYPNFNFKKYFRYRSQKFIQFTKKNLKQSLTLVDFIKGLPEKFWIALSAIATLFASFVALWKQNIQREPRLILDPSNFAGKSVPVNLELVRRNDGSKIPIKGQTLACFYHARVKNKRRKVLAKNVMVLCNEKRLLNSNAEVTEVIELHPPRSFAWAPAELQVFSPDISNHKTIDLLYLIANRDHCELAFFSKATTGEHLIPRGQDVELILEIVADNLSKTTQYSLKIIWIENRDNQKISTPCGKLSLVLSELKSK